MGLLWESHSACSYLTLGPLSCQESGLLPSAHPLLEIACLPALCRPWGLLLPFLALSPTFVLTLPSWLCQGPLGVFCCWAARYCTVEPTCDSPLTSSTWDPLEWGRQDRAWEASAARGSSGWCLSKNEATKTDCQEDG